MIESVVELIKLHEGYRQHPYRCPAGALGMDGHDKERCHAQLERSKAYVWERYGFDGYGCGLCQAGVPCEAGVPAHDLKLRGTVEGEKEGR